MRWLSYFFPRTIAKLSSLYNREIRINEEKGKLKLLVNGSSQSGSYIEMLWKEAFKEFQIPQRFTPKKILVLGVAGGTVVRLINSYYPTATITGVDIDQTMIDIGKKYFGLDKLDRLTFFCQDAETFVSNEHKFKRRYDIIIVDLFIGTHVPEVVRDESFLKKVKELLTPQGITVINYLHEFEYIKKSEELKKTLERLFPKVQGSFTHNNRFFLCRPAYLPLIP